MKRILLTFWMIIMAVTNAISQSENCVLNAEHHKEMVCLYVNSREYAKLSNSEKTYLINKQSEKYNAKSVCVVRDHKTELWLSMEGGMKMVDYWDMDSDLILSSKKTKGTQRRSLQHPWFFNISGAFNYTILETMSFNAYSRLGCYLLKGRWDLALNYTGSYNKGGEEEKGSFSNSIGVDSRVYILKGKAVNPFIGVGVAYAFGGGYSSITIPLSTGLSIPIKGKSCIDMCYQYNNVTKSTVVVGFTRIY